MKNAEEVGPLWRVALFGEMEVFRADAGSAEFSSVSARFKPNKASLLFAYLLLHAPQSRTREYLASLFWPEHDAKTGRARLRGERGALVKALNEAELPVSALVTQRYSMRVESGFFLTDVAAFDAARRRADLRPTPSDAAQITALEEAVALYRGEFLAGAYDVPDAEPWIETARRRYAVAFDDGLLRLSNLYATQKDWRRSLAYAHRAAENDPDDKSRTARVRELTERVRQEECLPAPQPQEECLPAPQPPAIEPSPQNVSVQASAQSIPVAPKVCTPALARENPALLSRPQWLFAVGAVIIAVAAGMGGVAFFRSPVAATAAVVAGDPGDLHQYNAYLAPAAQAMERGEYSLAFGHFRSALPGLTTPAERLQVASQMIELGKSAHYRGKGEGLVALAAFEEALEVFRAEKASEAVVDALLIISDTAMLRGDRSRALACGKEASRIVPTLEDGVQKAGFLNRLALWALELGEYDQASANLKQAMAIYRKGSSDERQRGVAFVLWSQGQYASDTGDYAAAKKRLTEAADRMTRLENEAQTRAAVLGDLGDAYFRAGGNDQGKARLLYEEGLREWEKVRHKSWTANFKARLAGLALWRAEAWAAATATRPGESDRGKEELRMAERLAQESLTLLEGSSAPVGRARPLAVLGGVYRHQARYPEARKALRECVAVRRQVGNPRTLAEALEALAVYEAQVSEYAAVRPHAQAAADLRKKAGTPIPPRDRKKVADMRAVSGLPPLGKR